MLKRIQRWFRSVVLDVVREVFVGIQGDISSSITAELFVIRELLSDKSEEFEAQIAYTREVVASYRDLVSQQKETIKLLKSREFPVESEKDGEEQHLVPRMKTLSQRRKEMEIASIQRRKELEAVNDRWI